MWRRGNAYLAEILLMGSVEVVRFFINFKYAVPFFYGVLKWKHSPEVTAKAVSAVQNILVLLVKLSVLKIFTWRCLVKIFKTDSLTNTTRMFWAETAFAVTSGKCFHLIIGLFKVSIILAVFITLILTSMVHPSDHHGKIIINYVTNISYSSQT